MKSYLINLLSLSLKCLVDWINFNAQLMTRRHYRVVVQSNGKLGISKFLLENFCGRLLVSERKVCILDT